MRPELDRKFKQFEKARESHQFDRIEIKFAPRADLHAFVLLNKLCPSDRDIIASAEHDVYYLEIDLDRLQTIATDDNIRDLVRCGVNYDKALDTLYLFT